MPDNTTLNAGTGGDVIRDKDRAGVKTQVVAIDINGVGTEVLSSGDSTNGLDVDVTRLPAATVAGAASLPAGTNNIGDVDVLTLPTLPAGTNNIGDVDVLTAPGTAADGAAGQPAVVHVLGGYDGTNVQTLVTDSTGRLHVAAVNSALPAGTNTIGNVGNVPLTSGGLSIATDIDLDETELEVKASAGQLFGWYVYNDGATEVYVKLYNDTAANVVVGTTVPVMTLGVPAGSGANVFNPHGIAFSAGICAAATTVATTADTTAPAANQVVANFFYK